MSLFIVNKKAFLAAACNSVNWLSSSVITGYTSEKQHILKTSRLQLLVSG